MSEHYFSETPVSDASLQEIPVTIFDHTFNVATMPGVFSHHALDKGTAVLLRKVPQTMLPKDAKVLDLGCGWGPISLALGLRYPNAQLFAVDVNERALALCEKNLNAANISATVAPEPRLAQQFDAQGTQIDLIWANPPIRIGKDALHQLLQRWLNFLSPTGQAYFVVQKNLGADSLSKWLTERGFPTQKIGSAKGFRILEVSRSESNTTA